uniref:Uncharacterized protein n=1 Tax=Arundo donax TaxID=35708 RepID=A0A0A9BCT2_ARUDO
MYPPSVGPSCHRQTASRLPLSRDKHGVGGTLPGCLAVGL